MTTDLQLTPRRRVPPKSRVQLLGSWPNGVSADLERTRRAVNDLIRASNELGRFRPVLVRLTARREVTVGADTIREYAWESVTAVPDVGATVRVQSFETTADRPTSQVGLDSFGAALYNVREITDPSHTGIPIPTSPDDQPVVVMWITRNKEGEIWRLMDEAQPAPAILPVLLTGNAHQNGNGAAGGTSTIWLYDWAEAQPAAGGGPWAQKVGGLTGQAYNVVETGNPVRPTNGTFVQVSAGVSVGESSDSSAAWTISLLPIRTGAGVWITQAMAADGSSGWYFDVANDTLDEVTCL